MCEELTFKQEERVRTLIADALTRDNAKGKGIEVDEPNLRILTKRVFRIVGEQQPDERELIEAEGLIREYAQVQVQKHL